MHGYERGHRQRHTLQLPITHLSAYAFEGQCSPSQTGVLGCTRPKTAQHPFKSLYTIASTPLNMQKVGRPSLELPNPSHLVLYHNGPTTPGVIPDYHSDQLLPPRNKGITVVVLQERSVSYTIHPASTANHSLLRFHSTHCSLFSCRLNPDG